MEPPRIQYVAAKDGVRIAYWVAGDGVPFLHMPPAPWSHLEQEWLDLPYARWYERLCQVFRVAHYDARGSGLSDRDFSSGPPESYLLDIDAVADRLGWERFALLGVSTTGTIAIEYAATRPERVTHLMLWDASLESPDSNPRVEALQALADTDWKLYTETIARAMVAGWGEAEAGSHFATIMQLGANRADADRFFFRKQGHTPPDTRTWFPLVRCPTLVLHRKGSMFNTSDEARTIAAGIADAQLALLEGDTVLPFIGDSDAVHRAIEGFLGVTPSQAVRQAPAPVSAEPTVRTILFTDIEAHTEIMSGLGDDRGRVLLREHERLTREALRAHGGLEVKTLGDGFMASFASAQRALECSIALQQAFAEMDESQPGGALRVRVGLNAGEPIAEDDDLFGASVIAAARIAHSAQGGEILAADVVRQLVAGKGFLFSDTGEHLLKGLEDPVRIWRVRWER